MAVTTMGRINQLAEERSRLYRQASNGRRADPTLRQRLLEINRELDALWDQRRQERTGRREGIDLLVDQEYERLYGHDYEDAIKPLHVDDAEEETAVLAA